MRAPAGWGISGKEGPFPQHPRVVLYSGRSRNNTFNYELGLVSYHLLSDFPGTGRRYVCLAKGKPGERVETK